MRVRTAWRARYRRSSEDLSRADMDGYNPKHYRVVEMSEEAEVIRRT
jgi:hypothetical protein